MNAVVGKLESTLQRFRHQSLRSSVPVRIQNNEKPASAIFFERFNFRAFHQYPPIAAVKHETSRLDVYRTKRGRNW
jgi:hypothetical protein